MSPGNTVQRKTKTSVGSLPGFCGGLPGGAASSAPTWVPILARTPAGSKSVNSGIGRSSDLFLALRLPGRGASGGLQISFALSEIGAPELTATGIVADSHCIPFSFLTRRGPLSETFAGGKCRKSRAYCQIYFRRGRSRLSESRDAEGRAVRCSEIKNGEWKISSILRFLPPERYHSTGSFSSSPSAASSDVKVLLR